MATDWAFHYLTQPLGLLILAAGIAIPFLIWRVVLGKSFTAFGVKPLALAYVAALVGLVVLVFIWSYSEFTNRVEEGLLQEDTRWSTVTGWTVYMGVLSLVFVLPLLGLVGVPLGAVLLRKGWLTVKSMVAVLLAVWLSFTLVILSLDTNFWRWGRHDQLESLGTNLLETLPGVLLIAAPFLGALLLTSKPKHDAAT